MSKNNKDGKPLAGPMTVGIEGNVVSGKKMGTSFKFPVALKVHRRGPQPCPRAQMLKYIT